MGKIRKRKNAGLMILSLIIFVTLVIMAGCQREYSNEEEDIYVVGVVMKSSTSEYWRSIRSGMETAAKEYNMEVVFFSPESELSEEAHEKMIRMLLRSDVDAVAVSAINSYGLADYFEQAEQAGIPLISYDTEFENETVPYIGIDNVKAGYELAKILSSELDHKGEVGIITGDLNQAAHRQRVEGFTEYMNKETDIKIAFIESGYSNRQMSEQVLHGIQEEYPELGGIMATSAVTAVGISDALAGEGVKIVTVDAQQDVFTALQKGQITAAAAQSGYDIGYETIRYIDKFRSEKVTEQDWILDAEVLNADNVDAYVSGHTRRVNNEEHSQ